MKKGAKQLRVRPDSNPTHTSQKSSPSINHRHPLAPACLTPCEGGSPSPAVKLGPNGTKWDLIRPNPAIKNKKNLAPLRFLCLLLLESHPPFRHLSPVLRLPPNCTQLHPIAPICTQTPPRGYAPPAWTLDRSSPRRLRRRRIDCGPLPHQKTIKKPKPNSLMRGLTT